MRTVIIIIAFFLAMGMSNVQAEIIWDTGHHVFSEGSETYVTMLNDASADITGGWIAEFSMYNETSVEVFGGTISALLCQDISTATIYDNDYMDLLRPNDSSTATVYGGEINLLFTLGSSETHLYGGLFTSGIDAVDSSIVNLYVESYEFDPTGGSFDNGLITGTWLLSGESFSIELGAEGTFDHINFVPEPCSAIFLISGSIILGAIRRNSKK